MRTTGKTIAAVAAACAITAAAIAVAGPATAATKSKAPAGTSFVAGTADGGVSIVLSRDRHQVRRALFAYKAKCSDGDTVYDYNYHTAIPMGANRKFTYRYESGPEASNEAPGATFSYTQAMSGTLNKAGTRIVGTARTTFALNNPAGGSYSCDTGTVKFKADD